MASTYSGALKRFAHYSSRPPVPGVNPEHEHPDPDPDPFAPAPDGVTPHPGDVWADDPVSAHTAMRVEPVTHTTRLLPPVPQNVDGTRAGLATTARMLANHSIVDYRPDRYIDYRHAAEGRTIEFTPGRAPQVAGESVPEASQYLMMGRNGYDVTNKPNEVYSAGESNVGRYRLGVAIEDFGHYEFHTQQGQDTHLRAYSGLHPAFPVDKPRVEGSAPYTPNSSGTATWTQEAFQRPSFFALPSETALTDFQVAGQDAAGEFDDEGRMY